MSSLILFHLKKIFRDKVILIAIIILMAVSTFTYTGIYRDIDGTKESYETNTLGYIDQVKLKDIDENDFYKKYNSYENIDNKDIYIYKFRGTNEQRAELNEIKRKDNWYNSDLFKKYLDEKIIYDFKIVNYQNLITLQDYEEYKDSIFVPSFSKNIFFKKMPYNIYDHNYPLWEEIKTMESQDSISNMLSREYWSVLEYSLSLILGLVIIYTITKEYRNKTEFTVKTSNSSFLKYIFSKTILIFFLFMIIAIVFSMLLQIIRGNKVDYGSFTFDQFDLMTNYLIFILPTEFFILTLSIFVSILCRDTITSICFMLFYIFLFSEGKLSEGYMNWYIKVYKYFPRINFGLEYGNIYFRNIVMHQIIYIIFAVLLILLSCVKLKINERSIV
ncbi:TPA: ABC transporter permease [Streptococcus pyogenes]|nr:ABC transporter permease [Streptococcus pyogenes]